MNLRRKYWPNMYRLVEELALLAFIGCLVHSFQPSFPIKELLLFLGPIAMATYGIKKAGDTAEAKYRNAGGAAGRPRPEDKEKD